MVNLQLRRSFDMFSFDRLQQQEAFIWLLLLARGIVNDTK
jgi:hypothetical protein